MLNYQRVPELFNNIQPWIWQKKHEKNSGQSGHGSNQFLLWRWSVLACLPISQESKAPRNQSPVKLLGDGKPEKGWNVKCRHVCETIKVWGMDYNHLVNRWNRWNRWYLSLYPHISWVYTHENPIIMVNLLLISTNHLWFLLSHGWFHGWRISDRKVLSNLLRYSNDAWVQQYHLYKLYIIKYIK